MNAYSRYSLGWPDKDGSPRTTVQSWLDEKRKSADFVSPPESRQHFDIWNFQTADDDAGTASVAVPPPIRPFIRANPFRPGVVMTISPLTVETAEITTAAVEIKTLTVRGKQVTLAVFRQLQSSSLVSPAGELLGTPWGTVNYHPDKCADDREHLHVVWQRGTELRRATVVRSDHFPTVTPISDATSADWLRAACLVGWRPDELKRGISGRHWINRDAIDVSLKHLETPEVRTVRLTVPVDVKEFWREITQGRYGSPAALEQLRVVAGDIPTYDEAESAVVAEIDRDLTHRRPALVERWAELCALPQLFIAA